MKITVLIEDETPDNALAAEHGLSLVFILIKTSINKSILIIASIPKKLLIYSESVYYFRV